MLQKDSDRSLIKSCKSTVYIYIYICFLEYEKLHWDSLKRDCKIYCNQFVFVRNIQNSLQSRHKQSILTGHISCFLFSFTSTCWPKWWSSILALTRKLIDFRFRFGHKVQCFMVSKGYWILKLFIYFYRQHIINGILREYFRQCLQLNPSSSGTILVKF